MSFDSKKLFYIAVFILIIISSMMYTVNQRYVGIEKFLGRIKLEDSKTAQVDCPNLPHLKGLVDTNNLTKRPSIECPGLHFKLPFLTTVLYFDTRLQTLGSQLERIPTRDQKFVYVDYFVKWRIVDFYKYYLSTGNYINRATELLQPKVSDSLKAEFGKKLIEEVVSQDRENIMSTIKTELKVKTKSLGIDIIDMRIKRIDLPEEVRESVYNRMRTKRQKVANEHRYEGQRKAEAIKAEADFNAKKIIAEANKQSEILRGKADADAAKIYSDAFNQNPEFYQFYRSLNAYTKVFANKENVLVLGPDSDFFSYFNKQNANIK